MLAAVPAETGPPPRPAWATRRPRTRAPGRRCERRCERRRQPAGLGRPRRLERFAPQTRNSKKRFRGFAPDCAALAPPGSADAAALPWTSVRPRCLTRCAHRASGRPAPCCGEGARRRAPYCRALPAARAVFPEEDAVARKSAPNLNSVLIPSPDTAAAAMRQDPGPSTAGHQLGRTDGRLRRPQRQLSCITRPESGSFRGPDTSFRLRNEQKGQRRWGTERCGWAGVGLSCNRGSFPSLRRFKAERMMTVDSDETRRLLADISTLSKKFSLTVTHIPHTHSLTHLSPLPITHPHLSLFIIHVLPRSTSPLRQSLCLLRTFVQQLPQLSSTVSVSSQ